jgi:hypothetical protein
MQLRRRAAVGAGCGTGVGIRVWEQSISAVLEETWPVFLPAAEMGSRAACSRSTSSAQTLRLIRLLSVTRAESEGRLSPLQNVELCFGHSWSATEAAL